MHLRTTDDLGPLVRTLLQHSPRCLALTGPLGAGKTTLTQVLAKQLGVRESVTSPTYALQHVYTTHHKAYDTLVHVDCYRLKNPDQELPALDLEHWLQQPRTLVVIEWAERIKKFLAGREVTWVTLTLERDNTRRVRVS